MAIYPGLCVLGLSIYEELARAVSYLARSLHLYLSYGLWGGKIHVQCRKKVCGLEYVGLEEKTQSVKFNFTYMIIGALVRNGVRTLWKILKFITLLITAGPAEFPHRDSRSTVVAS